MHLSVVCGLCTFKPRIRPHATCPERPACQWGTLDGAEPKTSGAILHCPPQKWRLLGSGGGGGADRATAVGPAVIPDIAAGRCVRVGTIGNAALQWHLGMQVPPLPTSGMRAPPPSLGCDGHTCHLCHADGHTTNRTCPVPPLQGGEQVCQGTISTGIISEGEIFATSRNPETCCYFLVGCGWFLLVPGRLPMVPDISWWALDGNKHIFDPSLRLLHISEFSTASELAVKLLVTLREKLPGGKFRHFSPLLYFCNSANSRTARAELRASFCGSRDANGILTAPVSPRLLGRQPSGMSLSGSPQPTLYGPTTDILRSRLVHRHFVG